MYITPICYLNLGLCSKNLEQIFFIISQTMRENKKNIHTILALTRENLSQYDAIKSAQLQRLARISKLHYTFQIVINKSAD